jgi:hypothetical protein
LAGEATRRPHIEKSTSGRCQQNLKQHLTLIFKVDIFSPGGDRGAHCGTPAANPNDVLMEAANGE